MKSKSKMRRAVRFAPVAASLTALALVAACARTNGKAPITPETKAKVVQKLLKSMPDYDQSSPAALALAARIAGASIVIENQSDEGITALIKVVTTDGHRDLIARGSMPRKNQNDTFFRFMDINGNPSDDELHIEAHCVGSCQSVVAEIVQQAPETPADTSAAKATAAAPAASAAPAGDKGQAEIALGADVKTPDAAAPAPAADATKAAGDSSQAPASQAAPAQPTADAAPAPAPAPAPEGPKPTMKIVAKDIIIFMIQDRPAKPEEGSETKAVKLGSMKVEFMGPSQSGIHLMTYEEAYQQKYKQPAPADSKYAPADGDLENERDGGDDSSSPKQTPAVAAPAATDPKTAAAPTIDTSADASNNADPAASSAAPAAKNGAPSAAVPTATADGPAVDAPKGAQPDKSALTEALKTAGATNVDPARAAKADTVGALSAAKSEAKSAANSAAKSKK